MRLSTTSSYLGERLVPRYLTPENVRHAIYPSNVREQYTYVDGDSVPLYVKFEYV